MTEEEEYEQERLRILQEEWKENWIDELEEEITIQMDEPVEEEGRPPWKPDRKPQRIKDLLTKVFPEKRWLAEPVLATEGIALLAAESGTYKTWLGLWLAICIALGKDWLEFKVSGKGKVLYLNGELPEQEMQRRAFRLAATEDLEIDFIHAVWHLDSADDFAELIDLVSREKYNLIIGDTLSKLHSGRAEENDNDAMTDIMIKARQIAYASGGLFLILHHVSKPPGFPLSLLHRIRGASAIRDNAGSALLLQKQERGREAPIHMSNPKNWYGSEAGTIKFWLTDDDELLSTFKWEQGDVEDVEEAFKDEILERIQDYFDLHEEFGVSQLRGGLSSGAQKVMKSVLDELESSGVLHVFRRGLKKIVAKGPEWL